MKTYRRIRAGLLALLCAACAVAIAATVEYTYDANGRLTGVYAPSGEAAQYVYDPAGNITQILRFPATQLAVTEFTPQSGPVGTQVFIYGTGFNTTPASNTVAFNGAAATVTAATANKLTTTVPAGATTGPVTVTVGTASASSATNFVVTSGGNSAPSITAFSPSMGVAGTAVSITGSNFDPTAALNQVTFNGTSASTSSATATTVSTVVPTYAGSGPIKVRTRNGTATSAGDFIVPFGPIAAADITGSYRAVVDGATASFTIPTVNKTVFVLFDGIQGQNLGIGMNMVGCTTVIVERPDNRDLLANAQYCTNSTVDLPTLPLTGTYVVAITSQMSAAMNVVLTVSSDSTGTLGAEGVVSTFSISRAGQNGRYQFNASAGQQAAFYVSGLASAIQPTRIDLIHPNGQVVVSSTSTGSSAYIQLQTLDAGSYSLRVSPQNTNTGSWSIQYGQPDLTIQSLSLGTVGTAQNGAYTIPFTAVVRNQGTVGAKASIWTDESYLSTDAALDTTDSLLGSTPPAADIAAGATYTVNATGTTSTSTADGAYTLFFKTDGADSASKYSATPNKLLEPNENNNVASAPVTLPGRPDLVASNITFGAFTVNQNGTYSFPVTFTITNTGPTAAKATWADHAFISSDATLDTTDTKLGFVNRTVDLAPAGSYTVSINATTVAGVDPGTYTLFGKADAAASGNNYSATGVVTESNEANNTASTSITLPGRPDLAISNLVVGGITVDTSGWYTIPVTFTVTNVGQTTSQPYWLDYCFLSTDGILDSTDGSPTGTTHNTSLAPGASYNVSLSCRANTSVTPGSYTLFAKTDTNIVNGKYSTSNNLVEADETNNVASQSITLPVRPDLAASGLSVGTVTVNADGSYSIPISVTVQNIGGFTAQGPWLDACYLSIDAALDTTDPYIGGTSHSTNLEAGSSYTMSMTCRTSTTTTPGTYTLFLKTDGSIYGGKYDPNPGLYEGDETNNTVSQSVTLPSKP